jgi:hypothetical protein
VDFTIVARHWACINNGSELVEIINYLVEKVRSTLSSYMIEPAN